MALCSALNNHDANNAESGPRQEHSAATRKNKDAFHRMGRKKWFRSVRGLLVDRHPPPVTSPSAPELRSSWSAVNTEGRITLVLRRAAYCWPVRQPIVTSPDGRFTPHSHCGNSGSYTGVLLGI